MRVSFVFHRSGIAGRRTEREHRTRCARGAMLSMVVRCSSLCSLVASDRVPARSAEMLVVGASAHILAVQHTHIQLIRLPRVWWFIISRFS